MGIFDPILDALAARLQKRVQGLEPRQSFRDYDVKGRSYSVESMVCESLANLTCMQFEMPVDGSSQRALALDGISDEFVQDTLVNAIALGFLTGDVITVPSWDGHRMTNTLVGSGSFAITGSNGRDVTSCIYVVDRKVIRYDQTYTLMRLVELVPYIAEDGTRQTGTHYHTYVMADGGKVYPLDKFPDWAAQNEEDWFVPATDRLLIGRFRSFTLDPLHPNAQKGTPICYGASAPIKEIHYITQQMHNEFALSEKAIIADKTLFRKEYRRDSNGNVIDSRLVFPEGRRNLFMDTQGSLGDGRDLIKEWAPTIQLQPYLDALEKQYAEVERCVGVSSGILSNLNEQSYQNVDNVRKATIKTQSFVNSARNAAETYLDGLLYSWDTLLNFYGVTPVGDWHAEYKWSDDYIDTFADRQNAILAGQSVGAFDAVDYRMFVTGEAPEVAAERVAQIRAEQPSALVLE